MTKNIIFIFAAFCTLQARADVQPTEKDTVRCTFRYDDTELLQPLQPSYLDGVVVPARGNGNWFVSITGGTTAFLGTPLGCEDLFGRLKPSYSLTLGKWFTPWVGARINYSGLQFKDGMLAVQEYHHLHADLLWNVLGGSYARPGELSTQPMSLWNFALEVHSGRVFIGSVATYVFVFLVGGGCVWCLWTGYRVRKGNKQ